MIFPYFSTAMFDYDGTIYESHTEGHANDREDQQTQRRLPPKHRAACKAEQKLDCTRIVGVAEFLGCQCGMIIHRGQRLYEDV